MTQIIVADIGGTHARFARAQIAEGGIVLGEATTMRTGDHAGFVEAWQAYVAEAPAPMPPAVAIAAAGPLKDGRIALTNAPWIIDPAMLRTRLGVQSVILLNDFAAVAHAAACAEPAALAHIAGPDRPLPALGTVTVLGPGTGLGVAAFHRASTGLAIIAGEGGHSGFAPQDALEDGLLEILRVRYGRAVSEHVVAGPGIAVLYEAMGGATLATDRDIWAALDDGRDTLAEAAAERFCAALGSVAGDYALVHGAGAVVLAGGLANRLARRIARSQFAARFCAKPRYEAMMADIPIKLLTHPQPGLLGAAAAHLAEQGACR